MTEYTFTFNPSEEARFRSCIARLDPSEYVVVKDTYLVTPEDNKYSDKGMVIEMDPEAALTCRLGMKSVKIRRARSEEELAEEQRIVDMNTVKVMVKVHGADITIDDVIVVGPGSTKTP